MENLSAEKIALVAVENCRYSYDQLFSFIVPEEFCGILQEGMRVLVPFGRGSVLRQGFVFEFSPNQNVPADKELKKIYSVIDSEPLLSKELLSLAKWLKDRTFCTYFIAAKAMLPSGMCVKSEKIYSAAGDIPEEIYEKLSDTEKSVVNFLLSKKKPQREKILCKKFGIEENNPLFKILVKKGVLTESADVFSKTGDLSFTTVSLSQNFLDFPGAFKITEKQLAVIEALSEEKEITVKELCYYSGCTSAVIKTLIKNGVLKTVQNEIIRTPENVYCLPESTYEKPVLSAMQREAFNKLYNAFLAEKAQTALLYGVTGSGKTGVYMELIDKVLESGKNVIVLVPEISLTPQVFSLFMSRYGKNTAVIHSGLSAGERYDEWKRIKRGDARVVIGTRSAIFSPLQNIGLIVIDEEQEHTYKSEMSPRYNAKDAARFRAASNNALLVLASATPSVETYAKALSNQYLLCELTERYGKANLPEVHTVDMTDKTLLNSFFALSDPLSDEIEKNLENGEQTILLINRRGFNTFAMCPDCKKVMTCPNCSISMTYHSANNRLMCHYCGYSVPYTEKCPSCGAENIRYAGFGTQRVEKELELRFPKARVLRMDADTVTGRNAHSKALSAFSKGEYDILIGTQMVAKGLDFPSVTLVGVTSADKELYNNDFRSAERTFDLITQVVGRAGRGKKGGRAVIQTLVPENDIISVASKQDYKSFYKGEIILRKALIYPPFCDICLIAFSSLNEESTSLCADAFFKKLVELNSGEFSEEKIIILGPMYPRVSKINNLYRKKIIIKCKNTENFRGLINKTLKFIYSDRDFRNVSIYADINPETTE